ncbi:MULTISPECIES: glycine betaine ABC transporter substrate-binding protein [Vibrio]|jgi:osmoprotectant transport system substrate-binding protein|uniref:glycine betaine ABC transporter substrate-binding protein n=1 Tax=Vibrio TaxID=662 RepID=UPI001BD4AB5A|nr:MULTISPECIES: glycine betaine ABC transporter substrate-binding protein [Vibrio]EGQ9097730.1 glycine/betaine ABC transporter substrate-binding protein [Vibrio alginolyticus]EIJ2377902.1 glycine betaine ABC transporter substrate-binding protein [Vibrio alginolyticus]EJT1895586.1 glycine betaine ABC transporter substrate-binding protein [Vibrio alginolyticus]EKK7177573.1 glycine betaine ABC transporter substrate-binding protein [Vibrio alginolyticus]ELA7918658.1 glycine betaine ABC transporte
MLKQITRRLLAVGVLLSSFHASAEIVVGGKNFTEQQLLTEITSQYLTKKGYDVDKRSGMGSAVLRKAQENGQIDLYWEYTGTSLIIYNKVKDKLPAEQVYQHVKELDAKKGLVWLNPSKANNTYALAMRSDDAKQRGISTLSEFAEQMRQDPPMTIALNAEFYARKDGFRPLQKTYKFKASRDQVKRMDTGLTYDALKGQEVDAALVFATDGRIKAFGFTVLTDDKQFFPDYAITPVVRQETLDANPDLAEQMNALSAAIDGDTMSTLNQQVDVERRSISEVASQFLSEHNLG